MNDDRKAKEREFHNFVRGPEGKASGAPNDKYYTVSGRSAEYVDTWLARHCRGATALDYGSGDGRHAIRMAELGATVSGIDISDVSVENARREAADRRMPGSVTFTVGDAEQMGFADNTFDVIHIDGVLHHLDVSNAFPELRRVLRPGGRVIAREALGHNPVIQWYRERTPSLRTAWEKDHIIKRSDLQLAGRYFKRMDLKFFHLAAIAAVPLRGFPIFKPLVRLLDHLDSILLSIPGFRWLAWMVVFELSEPTEKGV